MRTFAVAVTLLFAGGCYAPSPPGGSYRCSTIDNKTCPSGQSCDCGLCVSKPTQAACKFTITTSAPSAASTLSVNEHQTFSINVNAFTSDGSAASEFAGEVTLSSSWGDVKPNTVKLANGTATISVELNRETLPPQTAKLHATFLDNKGDSGKIAVVAQKFIREPDPIVPPATALKPFGWASVLVAQPNIIKVDGGYRMYFVGIDSKNDTKSSIGVATSTDGKTWSPLPDPVINSPLMGGLGTDLASPSVFKLKDSFHGVVSKGGANGREIGEASSADGLSAWTVYNSGTAVLKPTDCAYCSSTVDFPQVIPDPTSLDSKGDPTSWIMFFNASRPAGDSGSSVSLGRAQSDDGFVFTPEPAPLLSGDLTGEALLFAPRVLVDGTVFKMWYSFARIGDIVNLLDLCDMNTHVSVGYATSDDGFYWIRSPSNPVLDPSDSGWDAGDHATLVSSVLASDGSDAASGIDLYYTTFRRTGLSCLPNGIGKATRP